MAKLTFSAADFTAALQALLPRGRVWPRDDDAVQTKVLTGLARAYARQVKRSNDLLDDAFPATTYELLPEWESTLALPDPLLGLDTTLQGRRNQVVSKLLSVGGQSVAYMIAYAEKLGYTITVTQFAPARTGQMQAGDPVNGEAWAHAWQVNAAQTTVISFRASQSTAGEALAKWGNDLLESAIRKVAPAHTVVIFSYS